MTLLLDPQGVEVGTELPALELPPLSRLTLALYCGASGDHNPIHVDIDFAKRAGYPDVFAHGMLSMAFLARALTAWVPQKRLLSYGVRFAAITQVADRVQCTGKVVEKLEYRGRPCVRIELTASRNGEQVTLSGDAIVALD